MKRAATAAALMLAAAACLADTVPVCSWDSPGRDPFRGSAVAVVLGWSHVPFADRLAMSRDLGMRKPTAQVVIDRRGLVSNGAVRFTDGINDMRFGRSRVCASVTMTGWPEGHEEPAQAYCSGAWCAVVPTVCGSVFWTRRAAPGPRGGVQAVPEPAPIALVAVAALAAWVSRKIKPRPIAKPSADQPIL